MSLPDKFLDKVKKAASQSYEEYSVGFSEFSPEHLFQTAYLHGYNCAYNIYDVAEEKVKGMIKQGENPIKDVPIKSIDVPKQAEAILTKNKNTILNKNSKDLYEFAYEQGFSNVWDTYMNTEVSTELENLVNYYLSGERNSANKNA
jgi:hypothetical protein